MATNLKVNLDTSNAKENAEALQKQIDALQLSLKKINESKMSPEQKVKYDISEEINAKKTSLKKEEDLIKKLEADKRSENQITANERNRAIDFSIGKLQGMGGAIGDAASIADGALKGGLAGAAVAVANLVAGAIQTRAEFAGLRESLSAANGAIGDMFADSLRGYQLLYQEIAGGSEDEKKAIAAAAQARVDAIQEARNAGMALLNISKLQTEEQRLQAEEAKLQAGSMDDFMNLIQQRRVAKAEETALEEQLLKIKKDQADNDRFMTSALGQFAGKQDKTVELAKQQQETEEKIREAKLKQKDVEDKILITKPAEAAANERKTFALQQQLDKMGIHINLGGKITSQKDLEKDIQAQILKLQWDSLKADEIHKKLNEGLIVNLSQELIGLKEKDKSNASSAASKAKEAAAAKEKLATDLMSFQLSQEVLLAEGKQFTFLANRIDLQKTEIELRDKLANMNLRNATQKQLDDYKKYADQLNKVLDVEKQLAELKRPKETFESGTEVIARLAAEVDARKSLAELKFSAAESEISKLTEIQLKVNQGLNLSVSEGEIYSRKDEILKTLLDDQKNINSELQIEREHLANASTDVERLTTQQRILNLEKKDKGVEAGISGFGNALDGTQQLNQELQNLLNKGDLFGALGSKIKLGLDKAFDGKASAQIANFSKEVGELGTKTLGGIESGFKAGLASIIEGKKTFGEAAKEMLHQVLLNLAVESSWKALAATANGFISLATYQYPQAAASFTAAGIYALIAGGAAAGAYATNPSSATSSSSAGGQSSSSGKDSGISSNRNNNESSLSQPIVVNIGNAWNQQQTQEIIVQAVRMGNRRFN
jgi:hypothetical protein